MSKEKDEVLSAEEIKEIWQDATRIADLPLDDVDNFVEVKKVVCSFYETCPEVHKPIAIGGCSGCSHNDTATLANCRDEYLKWIYLRPMKKWREEFTDPVEVENKISMSERKLGLKCDVCHVSTRCPQYKAGHLCSIDWGENIDPTNLSNKEIINRMIDIQFKRVNRETMFEDIEGGKSDPTVSSEMDRLTGLVAHRNNLDTRTAKLTIEASESSSDNAQSSGGSLLASIFGGGSSDKKEPESLPSDTGNTINIDAKPIDAEVIEEPKQKETKKRSKRRSRD